MTHLLLDGTWLAARAAFAVPGQLKSPAGEGLNAILGFFGSQMKLVREIGPTHIGVAFDPPGNTFRHRILPTYKAGRPSLPRDFQDQQERIKATLTCMGITIDTVAGAEADDILASWAARCAAEGLKTKIVSGDRDLLQLISDPFIAVLRPRSRRLSDLQEIDAAGLKELYDLNGSGFLFYKALLGDASDNIPGVPGVGQRRATLIARRFGSLENLLAQPEGTQGALEERVRLHKDVVRRNLQLMSLHPNVVTSWPIARFSPDDGTAAKWQECLDASAVGRIASSCSALFSHLRSRAEKADGPRHQPSIAAPEKTGVRRIALVACSSKKADHAAEAQDLYTSTLFQTSRKWASTFSDEWYIISARHGLLHPRMVVEPYDQSLRALSADQVREWATGILTALRGVVRDGDVLSILAGNTYTRPLLEKLAHHKVYVHLPLAGRSLGVRMQWLSRAFHEPDRQSYLNRFYDLIRTLQAEEGYGRRQLGDSTGRMAWPSQGLYFFFEAGQSRVGFDEPRVVRVGTHAVGQGAKSSLWSRLRTHKGITTAGGSHRSSIFRLHVGAALLASSCSALRCPSWGKSAPVDPLEKEIEREVERRVSDVIGKMEVLTLLVPGDASPDSDRAFLERNSIALLSTTGAYQDPPFGGWLGFSSREPVIRRTGLWNLQHSEASFDPRFLDVLEEYVELTLGRRNAPDRALAPDGWRRQAGRSSTQQLDLFLTE